MKVVFTANTFYGFDDNAHRKIMLFIAKIARENPDVIIHAGNWGAHNQESMTKCIEAFRYHIPKTPILTVRGNRDFRQAGDLWQPNSLMAIDKIHKALFAKHNITLLNGQSVDVCGHRFCGIDSWFSHPKDMKLESYSIRYVDGDLFKVMSDRCQESIKTLTPELWGKKVKLVSHFLPPRDEKTSSMLGRVDTLFLGTSKKGESLEGATTYVSNSSLESPRYKIVTFQ